MTLSETGVAGNGGLYYSERHLIVAERADNSICAALAPLSPAVLARDGHPGIATYRLLTGCEPADADIEDDEDFDRHVLASILSVAAMEGAIAACAGLAADDLVALVAQYFPAAGDDVTVWCVSADRAEDDEIAMVRDLLLGQRSTEGDAGRWLAAMIARRSMEPNHLWEDLGLRERPELTRLLTRHFGRLAARNTKNMKWKRFFYRMLCEGDGFVMCTTPVCTQCNDFDVCFGDESGESRMAERRREFAREASAGSAAAAIPSRAPE